MNVFRSGRRLLRVLLPILALLCGASGALLGVCGPFTDVSDAGFCPFVLEIFTLGITTGTTPTTYDPAGNVTRLQMAAFLSRGVDGILLRGSRRAIQKKFWNPQNALVLGTTSLPPGSGPQLVEFDGKDIWTANGNNTVSRVRAADGKLVGTWTDAGAASSVLVAMGRIFVTSGGGQTSLYRLDPSQPAGAVTTVATNIGLTAASAAFDGSRIWTANVSASVSIVTPGATLPWSVSTVTAGFGQLRGALFDASNIWVVNFSAATLLKLDSNGAILQTVTVGSQPEFPVFDGTNIWVPNSGADSVSVVRASTGVVLATLTGDGLNNPVQAAFDGQRVLVTNALGDSVSLWKAADLVPLGSFSTGAGTLPWGACSDGLNFWIGLQFGNKLARF
jgi:hypothetical protein